MGEITDSLRNRGVLPHRQRGLPWQQVADWFVPGNVYRNNEGTGWSRPDLIGAGAQIATGLPVAGILSRLLGGSDGRVRDYVARNPERFQRDMEAIQARALGLSQGVRDVDRFARDREEIGRRAAEHERNREPATAPSVRGPVGADGTTAAGRRSALGAGQLGTAGLAALLEYQNALNTRGGTMQER